MTNLFAPRAVAADLTRPTLISFVDLARWLAAMLVMVGHLRNPLLVGYGDIPAGGNPLWVKGWYFITGLHAEAVLVFFVLSGFLVGGLAAARMTEGKFDPPGYAVDRFARLYISFLPALVLTLLLDTIGTHWFASSGMWDASQLQMAIKDPDKLYGLRLGLGTFLGNAAMLQFYFVDPFGSNDPLWTLSSEFWFYAVFGLAVTAMLRRGATRLFLAALALAAILALGPLFVSYFGMWLIGFGVACLKPRKVGPTWLALLTLLAYLAFIRSHTDFFAVSLDRKIGSNYGLALVFGWLIMTLRGRTVPLLDRLAGPNKFMADFSYSLYLIHFPIIWLSIAVLGRVSGNPGYFTGFAPTDPVGLASYFGIVAFVIVLAWAFAQVTERHTKTLRDALKRRLIKRPKPDQPEPDRGHGGFE